MKKGVSKVKNENKNTDLVQERAEGVYSVNGPYRTIELERSFGDVKR